MKLFELKRTLKQTLKDNDLDGVSELAKQDRRVINILMSFSYDKETELSWRAISAVGRAAEVLLDTDYEFLRDTTRRLIWSVTEESGNVAWSSIEMLSEIVSSDIDRFSDLIPLMVSMYDEEIFREGVMYALSKIAVKSSSSVLPYKDVITQGLSDENPVVRYRAIVCAGKAGMRIPFEILSRLRSDKSEVMIYQGDSFQRRDIRGKAIEYEGIAPQFD